MYRLGDYVDEIPIQLHFSVVETYRNNKHGEEEAVLQLRLGDTVLWTEPHEASLYYDGYGDGGRSMQEAVVSDVIGPVLQGLFRQRYGWDLERRSLNGT